MANQLKSDRSPARFDVIQQTCTNIVRVILIVLIWACGFQLATRFANTESATRAIPMTSIHQPIPFVPVAGQWNFEIDSKNSVARLLPLPEGARTLCNRIGANNSVQMEIVAVNSTREQLFKLWRSTGWNVQAALHEQAGTFACYCARGDEFVYAWSACRGNQIETLMLVNSPTIDETVLFTRKNP